MVERVDWAAAESALADVRRRVFVQEQGVPESLEWDGVDPQCGHVAARTRDGTVIGTGRLLPDGHIGRMAVLAPWRRSGVGSAMLAELVEMAGDRGHREVILNAQCYVTAFYRRAGFRVTSGEFLEAGIPHVEMRKSLVA